MKVLLINSVYHKGSTGNIVENLYKEYKKTYETYVIFGRGNNNFNDKHIKRYTYQIESKLHHSISLFSGNMYGGMFFSTNRIIRKIKKINPDLIHVHCINGYFVNIYRLLRYLARSKKKVILTMHADFMMTGGCGYSLECNNYINLQCNNCKHFKEFNNKHSRNLSHKNFLKMKNAISKFDKNKIRITCVSPWLTDRYAKSPIYSSLIISTIINPVDNLFVESTINYNNNKNILYITPDINEPDKCGYLLPKLATALPDYNFILVEGKNNKNYFNCTNIKELGKKNKFELAEIYSSSFCSLILSKRETFSMIVAESLACGTPVYGFKCGGPESIAISGYSAFCNHGNIDTLANIIKKEYGMKLNRVEIKKQASKKYSITSIAKEYLELFK